MKNHITPEIKALPGGFIAVGGLPSDAETIHVAYNDGYFHLIYFRYNGDLLTRKRLPKGRYTILGWSDQPEVAEQVVEVQTVFNEKSFYKNYTPYESQDYRDIVENSFSSAIDSLSSLLRQLGIGGKALILRKD